MRRIQLRSEAEIEKIHAAGQVVAEVFTTVRAAIKPGVSTMKLNELLETVIRARGGRPASLGYGDPPFPAAACFSINEEIVHGIPRADRYLAQGDFLTVDVVVELNGYMADAARTYCVGTPTEAQRHYLETAERAFWTGIREARPGKRVGDLSAAIEAVARSAGMDVVRELTGHGIGQSMHEAPNVPNYGKPGRGPRFEAGMVIAVEPMLTAGRADLALLDDGWTVIPIDRSLSVHYENTIVVTENGPRVLTMTDEELAAQARSAVL